MSSGPQGPQDPSEHKKHVFSSKLSNNSLRTDPKHPSGLLWAPNAIRSKKNTSLVQNYLKIHWKKTSDIPSKLPDSNMTNPLPLFIKKEREGGEALQLCHPFYFGRAIFDYPRSENLEHRKDTKKRVFFDVPSSKTLFCTLYHAQTLQRESKWWFLCTNQWVVGIFAHSTAINHNQRCSGPENIFKSSFARTQCLSIEEGLSCLTEQKC